MSLLEDLPFSLCQPGPEDVDGVGNYFLQVLAPSPSHHPMLTLFLLDSHGQVPSKVQDPDYDPIKQSPNRLVYEHVASVARLASEGRQPRSPPMCLLRSCTSLCRSLETVASSPRGGRRREPTEGPSFNSHFYDALVQEDVAAVGCGHDHVNDFCGLLPRKPDMDGNTTHQAGPWLCYGGGSGFGGYCSYDGHRYHRRTRIWEFDTNIGSARTWKRVEYHSERVDELLLVKQGAVVSPSEHRGESMSDNTDQAVLL